MRWDIRGILATIFAIEALWLGVRTMVRIADGRGVFSILWVIGSIVGPLVLLSAAWFVQRRQPPTLLRTALTRTLVISLAVLWNLLLAYSISLGYFPTA
jgi:hypothetical protein